MKRVNDEIAKTEAKIIEFQTRLKDLKNQKTELENTAIIAIVRGADIRPEELRAFVDAYLKQQGGIPRPKPDKECDTDS